MVLCYGSFIFSILNFYFIVPSQLAGDNAMKNLKFAQTLEDFQDADVIIEAIVESEDVKKTLFLELDKIAKVSAILASNTSSISITRLASATSRPSQVR